MVECFWMFFNITGKPACTLALEALIYLNHLTMKKTP
jgi:hypothetical protein